MSIVWSWGDRGGGGPSHALPAAHFSSLLRLDGPVVSAGKAPNRSRRLAPGVAAASPPSPHSLEGFGPSAAEDWRCPCTAERRGAGFAHFFRQRCLSTDVPRNTWSISAQLRTTPKCGCVFPLGASGWGEAQCRNHPSEQIRTGVGARIDTQCCVNNQPDHFGGLMTNPEISFWGGGQARDLPPSRCSNANNSGACSVACFAASLSDVLLLPGPCLQTKACRAFADPVSRSRLFHRLLPQAQAEVMLCPASVKAGAWLHSKLG